MFSNGSYLKIWEVKNVSDKYTDVRATTSKKTDSGTYEQDFGGFVRLIGKANNQFKNAGDKPSLKIEKCGVTSAYVKEKNTTYTNFIVFEFADSNSSSAQPSKPAKSSKPGDGFMSIPDQVDEELPFA